MRNHKAISNHPTDSTRATDPILLFGHLTLTASKSVDEAPITEYNEETRAFAE